MIKEIRTIINYGKIKKASDVMIKKVITENDLLSAFYVLINLYNVKLESEKYTNLVDLFSRAMKLGG